MISILLALSCPNVVMLNTSKYPWNDYDHSMLTQAKLRCGQIYKGSSCVKLFKKFDVNSYSIVCGEPSEQ